MICIFYVKSGYGWEMIEDCGGVGSGVVGEVGGGDFGIDVDIDIDDG